METKASSGKAVEAILLLAPNVLGNSLVSDCNGRAFGFLPRVLLQDSVIRRGRASSVAGREPGLAKRERAGVHLLKAARGHQTSAVITCTMS